MVYMCTGLRGKYLRVILGTFRLLCLLVVIDSDRTFPDTET